VRARIAASTSFAAALAAVAAVVLVTSDPDPGRAADDPGRAAGGSQPGPTVPPAESEPTETAPTETPPETTPTTPPPRSWPRVRWRRSLALGAPWEGRLLRGVRLPRAGGHFFTWDPVLRTSPNRHWRRWGSGRLVRLVLRVARELRAAHPGAPRIAVGDLSRPRGGDFGPRFGALGHASHQNGLDVDVYYPRRDRRELRPARVAQIDLELAQDLLDRFLASRAVEIVFVGPATALTGPRRRVQPLVHHDDHMHVRLRGRPGAPRTPR
jgi:hypothetical protein